MAERFVVVVVVVVVVLRGDDEARLLDVVDLPLELLEWFDEHFCRTWKRKKSVKLRHRGC